MALHLIVLTPDHQTRRVPLEGDGITLGRAHTNDLCYAEDASLSRRHMRFMREGQEWWAEDLGSKNGSILNGTRISGKQRIGAGDRFAVGHLLITVVDPEAGPDRSVVFVPEAGPEIRPDATLMTSLEGLLSAESTMPLHNAALRAIEPDGAPTERRAGQAFANPVVRALVHAGRELAGNRPLEELFPLILNLSIEAVGADRGVLMTLESDQLVSRAVHGEGFRISTMVRDRVLEEKSSLLVRNIGLEEAFKRQESISEQHIHSMMAVPLQTEQRVIGLIYVDSRSFVREFTQDELNLLTVLANVAAIRIENQRLVEIERQEQLRTADLVQAYQIQRRILPSGAPRVAGLDLAGHNAPSRMVGGDYYDFIVRRDGKVVIVLGDVAGKGMAAALLMTNLQAMVRILSEEPEDPAKLMSRLDQSVAANCPSNRFITLILGLIDLAENTVTCCNAGHNPAFLVTGAGEVQAIPAGGTALGILPGMGYRSATFPFAPGDLLAVYSDGVTEAANHTEEEFGEQRLIDLLVRLRGQDAESVVDQINDALEEFTSGLPAADDVTLLVARRTG